MTPEGLRGFDADEILTDRDQALIGSVDGGDPDPTSGPAALLKVDIAEARFYGWGDLMPNRER
jgi:hypothetical protein